MNDGSRPNLVIIGGPNGAGKSTVASFLVEMRSIHRYINADTIAHGMSLRDDPADRQIAAGKVMLGQLYDGIAKRQNLASETTLSGRAWHRTIETAKSHGYEVTLCFVMVSDPEISIERVAFRAKRGGHSIPAPTIRRRYARALRAFFDSYQDAVEHWYFFDNSGLRAELIAAKEDAKVEILNMERYEYYRKKAL